jgi:hypothetical protein
MGKVGKKEKKKVVITELKKKKTRLFIYFKPNKFCTAIYYGKLFTVFSFIGQES